MAGEARTVRRKLVRRRQAQAARPEKPATPGIPRIARLMACAIVFDEMLRRGEVRSYKELAAIAQVSAARISQIMGLLDLAPGIQEELLSGNAHVSERELRPLVATVDWPMQTGLWESLLSLTAHSPPCSPPGTAPPPLAVPESPRT